MSEKRKTEAQQLNELRVHLATEHGIAFTAPSTGRKMGAAELLHLAVGQHEQAHREQ